MRKKPVRDLYSPPPAMSPVKPSRGTTVPPTTRVLRSHSKPAPVEEGSSDRAARLVKRRRRRAGADPWTRKRIPKKNPRPRAPPPTHFTCRICVEEKPTDHFIKWLAPRFRFHGRQEIPFDCMVHLSRNPRLKNDPVCKDCIGASMSAKLDTLGAKKVSEGCLEPGCRFTWSFRFIMKYFPLDALEKYNQGMMRVWLEDIKTVKCINAKCEGIGMMDPYAAGYPQVECPDCKVRMCAQCAIPWHEGISCADYNALHVHEKMSDPEKQTLELMQTKDGKRCPNCYLVIEKDGGCDSMYCMSCRTYFNWQTAASAVPGKGKAAMQAYGLYGDAAPAGIVCEVDALNARNNGPGTSAPPPPAPYDAPTPTWE